MMSPITPPKCSICTMFSQILRTSIFIAARDTVIGPETRCITASASSATPGMAGAMPNARQAFELSSQAKVVFRDAFGLLRVLCLTVPAGTCRHYNILYRALSYKIDRIASRAGTSGIWFACQPRARLVAGVADVVRAEQPWALPQSIFRPRWTRCKRRDDVCENTPRLSARRFSSSLKSCVCERDARAGRGLAQRGPLK